MLDFGFGLLSFYDNIMCVSQPCALVWMFCDFILKYFPMFISLVQCFMISVLNVWMLYLFAYHGHGNLSHWQFLLVVLSLYAFVHYHHFAAPVILCTLVLLEVCLGLHYLQFVFMYWNLCFSLILALNHVDIYLVWYCCWFFAVGLFSCRCLVNLPGVKTLLLTIHQHQLLKGLDYHHRHLKTPMRREVQNSAYLTHLLKHLWQVNSYSGTGGGV